MKFFKFKLLLVLMIIVISIPFLYFGNTNELEVTRIKETAVINCIEVSGIIEANKSIPVSLSYPVYIDKCYVKEDSYVNKGQLLFTVNTEKMENFVKESNFTGYTEASLTMDKSAFMNITPNIYATESGTVKDLSVYDGALLLSDENMCVIAPEENYILKITLNQEDYSKIKVGDQITFCSVISPNKYYTASVIRKKASVRKESSVLGKKTVIDVYAEIDSADEYIVDGLEVIGTVTKQPVRIKFLPFEYINQDDSGEYVLIYNTEQSAVEKKYIETGAETENGAEILTPFDKDTIFIKNNNNCKGNVILKYEL